MKLLETTPMAKRKLHLFWNIKRGRIGLILCLQAAKFPKNI